MQAARPDAALARLLAGYAAQPGVADEMLDPAGRPRPVWAPLLRHLAGLAPPRRAAAFARAEQYLRDAGVYYRLYSEPGATERDWPLSHIPVLIDEAEWAEVAAGLIQRAELLEAVVADLYGPARLVADGHLPAALIAASPEWLRPLVGVRPVSGHHLHFLAFEIGRNPDGSWFVLGDRTQAPSGAGFALETRMATARAFSDLFAGTDVHRLAGFFRAFRDTLNGLRADPDSLVGILTPGPLNDTYFEHAYIARYLGFTLLEGEDMAVQDGRLTVRTVEGARPVEVLWRRLDAGFADPLELDPASRLGTPGLVSALRSGRVAMVNALGSGVLEGRAMLAFLPRLARVVLGEPLRLPNIATWWCGQGRERAQVAARLAADPQALVIGAAQSTRLPFEADPGVAPPPGRAPADWLGTEGARLVAQERVTISTSPALEAGRLVPRPMSLRAFALRTPQGWQIMPGGFARIGRGGDATAIALQAGGAVADVWIVGPGAEPADSLLAPAAPGLQTVGSGELPARAADNLFWLGRYVERTEQALRLLRAWHLRLAEAGTPDRPLLTALAAHLARQGIEAAAPCGPPLAARIAEARACAAKLRDRFSTDGWLALAELARAARELDADPGDDAARALAALLPRIAAFSGLVHDNMYRATGWRCLALGRALERADAVAWTLADFAGPDAPEGGLDLAVELADSVMTHRRRFGAAMNRASVLDLLALDPDNPRSLIAQLDTLRRELGRLPHPPPPRGGRLSAPEARLLEAHTRLRIAEPAALEPETFAALRAELAALSDLIGTTWFG